jgi:hypothetical protein
VGGNPIVFDRVKGPYCWDVDGNKYIDYIGSWGPAIVGAANDEVNEALKAQIEKGTSFGAPSALEVSRLQAWKQGRSETVCNIWRRSHPLGRSLRALWVWMACCANRVQV